MQKSGQRCLVFHRRVKFFKILFNKPHIEQDGGGQRHNLRNRERVPYIGKPGEGQKVRRRQQDNKLPEHRNKQAADSLADRLEKRCKHNTNGRRNKADADGAKRGYADGKHGVARVEHLKQLLWQNPEQSGACKHDDERNQAAVFERREHPLLFLCAVVEADNRHNAVCQAEYRHKHEGLQLIIHAQNRNGGIGKGYQDTVHEENHDGAYRLHDNRREADRVNIFNRIEIETEMPEMDVHVVLLAEHDIDGKNHGENLPDDRRDRRAQHPELREEADAEDEQRVEDDVRHRTHEHKEHWVNHVARRLERLFEVQLHEYADGENQNAAQILGTHRENFRVVCKHMEERICQK